MKKSVEDNKKGWQPDLKLRFGALYFYKLYQLYILKYLLLIILNLINDDLVDSNLLNGGMAQLVECQKNLMTCYHFKFASN